MELQSLLVAKTGIPSDKYHLGKLILQALEVAPDYALQIDGVTGEVLTFREALDKSIRCAVAFRKLGLHQGDVVLLASSNNLNISIPYYASLYTGMIATAMDWTFGVQECQTQFEILKPKIIFCIHSKVQDIQAALKNIGSSCHVVSFGENQEAISFDNFLSEHGSSYEKFKATELNPEKTVATIIPTSGTTGDVKGAAISHKALLFHGIVQWTYGEKFPVPTKLALMSSNFQWLSAHMTCIASPILRYTRLACSKPPTIELLTDIINKYKPTHAILSSPLLALILSSPKCDLTCFKLLFIGGSAIQKDKIRKLQLISPNTHVTVGYGATEFGISHYTDLVESLGPPQGNVRVRLMDIETGEEIHEPNRNGELWATGPSIFEGYYNNPEETAKAFSEDGWFKSGDIFFRDEHGNYHFVERIKLLIKYNDYQVSPLEIESVILQHPGVIDAAVVGILDPDVGELAVAVVVRKDGASVSAADIKEIVKKNLTETKHLHGGVIFIEKLPLTASTKVNRQLLKKMVLSMDRE